MIYYMKDWKILMIFKIIFIKINSINNIMDIINLFQQNIIDNTTNSINFYLP